MLLPRGRGQDSSNEVEDLENILVTGNRVIGAEGLGIMVQKAIRSRIAGNTIIGIERREPFPGISWDGLIPGWEAANGSAICLSAGSDENQVLDNSFNDVAGAAVFLEGDRNVVSLRTAEDQVQDLGSGNQVTVRGGGRRADLRGASESVSNSRCP